LFIDGTGILLTLLVVIAASLPVSGGQEPDAALKAKVYSIVREVESISRKSRTLDELGSASVLQGQEMLSAGPGAVYVLSNCLANPDWKVRFWIIDMLGYLENPDARRPLMRVIRNVSEKKQLREEAQRSLKRLDEPLEHDAR